MNCANCGTQLRNNARFCSSCGTAVQATATQGYNQAYNIHPPTVCPLDGKDDAIEPVSAVVTGGEVHGTFSGVAYTNGAWEPTSGYASMRSELARLLAPPPEPMKPRGLHIFIWVLTIVTLGFCNIGSLLIGSIIPGLRGPTLYFALATIAFTLISTLLCIGYFFSVHKKYLAITTSVYAAEKPLWELAMKRWSDLYYCRRHNIVFDPISGKTCRPEELKKFLYTRTEQQTTGINIILSHATLAYRYNSRTPIVEIDGKPDHVSWGGHFIEVKPGRHTIKIYFKYSIWPECGAKSTEVIVGQGEIVKLNYYKTPSALAPGLIE